MMNRGTPSLGNLQMCKQPLGPLGLLRFGDLMNKYGDGSFVSYEIKLWVFMSIQLYRLWLRVIHSWDSCTESTRKNGCQMPGAAYVIQLNIQLYIYIYIYMECPKLDLCFMSINDAYIYIYTYQYILYMLISGFLRPQKMDGSPFRYSAWSPLRPIVSLSVKSSFVKNIGFPVTTDYMLGLWYMYIYICIWYPPCTFALRSTWKTFL